MTDEIGIQDGDAGVGWWLTLHKPWYTAGHLNPTVFQVKIVLIRHYSGKNIVKYRYLL